jgi:hypothetical protein
MVDPVTNVDLTEDPVAGQTLRFICGQVNGAARYIFRVLEPGNANPVILQATGTISQNYTVPSTPGRYIAQCQICTEGTDADRNNASCHPFENPTQNTLQGAIERASLEGSGTSIEEPVLETNNALQEEVGTNDALPLVEPNAVNGEDNPEEPAAANALQENEVQQEPENGNGSNGLDTSAQEAVTNNPDVAPPEQE